MKRYATGFLLLGTFGFPLALSVRAGSGEAVVSSLVVYESAEGAYGSCEPIRVSVTDDSTSMFRVGIYESEVSGTGNMWRASAWMSTAAAAQIMGFIPESRHVTFDVSGRIDGPSAGGIMTVGVLAAIRGDEVKPDAAMTGMINPDLSIGPVGGIPHKIQGAAKAGKKVVVIPAVSRYDFDKNLKREVDLIELGKSLGVEVVPAFDLFTAYRQMTGKELSRLPVAPDPTVPESIVQPLQSRTRQWLVRHDLWRRQYEKISEDAKTESANDTMQFAVDRAQQSLKLTREGEIVGAFRSAFESAFNAVDAYECARLSDIYQQKGIQAAIEEAKTSSGAWPKIDIVVDRIKAFQPATMEEAMSLIDALSCATEAMSLSLMADDLIAKGTSQLPEETGDEELTEEEQTARDEAEGEALESVVRAGIYYQYAIIDVETAEQELADARDPKGHPAPTADRVALLAQLYRRATDANLAMFESIHIEPRAQQQGVSAQAIQVQMMDEDYQYANLRMGLRVLRVYEKFFGKGTALDYATLTAMGEAYIASTFLTAKYYSLDVKEEDGVIVSVGREKTLREMLDFAGDQARRSIGALTQKGFRASSPIQSYLNARVKREREVGEKLDALSGYWTAHHSAQILAFLANVATTPSKP